jgi:lipopolysaccharide biosynthesis glycosyltransferase
MTNKAPTFCAPATLPAPSMINNPKRATVGQTLCPIVLACDNGYGMPLATTLRSLVDANPSAWPIECYVLSDGIAEQTKRNVAASLPEGSAVIRWVPVELSDFARFSTAPHISRITYARLLIAEILPPHIARILYLDTDLLVLGDLLALCSTDLEGAAMGAVLDSYLDSATKQNSPDYVNVPRVDNYFNAGVLLIDLGRWRGRRIAEKAVEYLSRHPDSPYSDQDALNVACNGQWRKLDSRWNFQGHCLTHIQKIAPVNRPAIVHFSTKWKPWIVEALNANASFYDSFRSRTRFARTPWERLRDGQKQLWARANNFLRRRMRPQKT